MNFLVEHDRRQPLEWLIGRRVRGPYYIDYIDEALGSPDVVTMSIFLRDRSGPKTQFAVTFARAFSHGRDVRWILRLVRREADPAMPLQRFEVCEAACAKCHRRLWCISDRQVLRSGTELGCPYCGWTQNWDIGGRVVDVLRAE